jgi:acetyl esterase/lipase
MRRLPAIRCMMTACALAGLLTGALVAGKAQADPITFADISKEPPPKPTEIIAYGTDIDQVGELSLPDTQGMHKIVILLHGGCWQERVSGTVLMSYIAEDLRKAGYAVWNLEYRRLGGRDGGYPGTFLDVANGIDYLRTLAQKYNLDLDDVAVVGHSAGGQLAAWAAARRHLPTASPLFIYNALPIRTVVSLAGILDLKSFHDTGPAVCGGPAVIEQLIGAADRAGVDVYSDTSPAELLPISAKQIIISGSLDEIVPASFGHAYADRAKAKGGQVKVIDIQGAAHFELIAPALPAWQEIKAALLAADPVR